MLALLLSLLSALIPVVFKLILDWADKAQSNSTAEAETTAVLNAPRTQAAVVSALNKGTF